MPFRGCKSLLLSEKRSGTDCFAWREKSAFARGVPPAEATPQAGFPRREASLCLWKKTKSSGGQCYSTMLGAQALRTKQVPHFCEKP